MIKTIIILPGSWASVDTQLAHLKAVSAHPVA
jgi:hypothetical protein